ncbi:MAG: N-acetylmuramic acid 6-phosphate etherase [Candidatus Omnitrophica bacterium]|nr:N-acetylmuramic acid 6-phosphate etherase [Candidatus Omnitrophota bacterium]
MGKIHYAKLPTEQPNPRSRAIDLLSIEKILALMNREDERVPKAVRQVKRNIASGVRLMVRSLKQGGKVYLTGAGTSGRFAVMEAAECPPTFSTPPSLVQAVMAGGRRAVFRSQEGAEDRKSEAIKIFRKKLSPPDLLIGISASGVTPFVEGALRAARQKKVKTILIAANAKPSCRKFTDCLIAPNVGPEIISGSTRLKAGTATKLILNMLTVTTMIQMGKVYHNWMVDLQPKSKKLTARAVRIIEHLGQVSTSEARRYLKQARGNVKTAILMARKKLSCRRAKKILNQHSGFLRKALEP